MATRSFTCKQAIPAFLVFSLNYCFAAAVLIATNKVEYLLPSRIIALWLVLILPSHIG